MQSIKNISTDFRNLAMALMAMVMFVAVVNGQPVVKIGDTTGCSTTEMLIPVNVENMTNIAALTLYISTDTNVVKYIGVEDINGEFATGDFIGGEDGGNQLVILNWFSLTPATIENGLMCNVRFLVKGGGSVDFEFQDNCEFINPDLSVVEGVQYVGGSLIALNSLWPEPVSQTITEGNSATIKLSGTIEGVEYQWQTMDGDDWINLEENEVYSGVLTPELSIEKVTADMNESLYRCLISNGVCSDGTSESELLVTPNGLHESLKDDSGLLIWPVPANDKLYCRVNADVLSGRMVLINPAGQIIDQYNLNDITSGDTFEFHLREGSSGLYQVYLYKGNHVLFLKKFLRN